MNHKTKICLDTLTVSSGCPTITLDAPVTKIVVQVKYVETKAIVIHSAHCIAL